VLGHERGDEEVAAEVGQEISEVSTDRSEVQRVLAVVDQRFRGGACREEVAASVEHSFRG